jgi:hypothetical protein
MTANLLYCYSLMNCNEPLGVNGNYFFDALSLSELPVIGDQVTFMDKIDSPHGTFRVVDRLIERDNISDLYPKLVTLYVVRLK